jgi:hypothetical protein
MPLLRHETGIKQDAEVLGDGWVAHCARRCKFLLPGLTPPRTGADRHGR